MVNPVGRPHLTGILPLMPLHNIPRTTPPIIYIDHCHWLPLSRLVATQMRLTWWYTPYRTQNIVLYRTPSFPSRKRRPIIKRASRFTPGASLPWTSSSRAMSPRDDDGPELEPF